jgi:hypothetical protein
LCAVSAIIDHRAKKNPLTTSHDVKGYRVEMLVSHTKFPRLKVRQTVSHTVFRLKQV